MVATKDLQELEAFGQMLQSKNYKHSRFIEPDIGDELTAIAIVPCPEVRKLCSRFKLAGK